MKYLLIDARPDERALTIQALRAAFPEAALTEITTQHEFAEVLAAGDFDVIITELQTGWTDGLSLLRQVKERMPFVPVIMVTACGDEETAVIGMKAGLSDYLPKKHLARLAAAVTESLNQARQCHTAATELERLKESEQFHRLITDLTSDFNYSIRRISDDSVVLEWITDAFTKITGYTAEEIKAQGGLKSIVHPDDLPAFLQRRERLLSGQPFEVEYRLRTKKGEVVWVRSSEYPIRDQETGLVTGAYGTSRDITERKHTEEQLRRAETRFRTLVEQIPAMTYLREPGENGRLLYVSPQVEQMLGFTPADWMSDREKRIGQLHPEDRERVFAEYRQHWRVATPLTCEYRMLTRNGRVIWLRDHATTLYDTEGQPLTMLGIMFDVSDRVLAEEEKQKLFEEISVNRDRLEMLSHRLIMAQEKERRYIARELHDQLGQSLTALKLNLQTFMSQPGVDDTPEPIEESVQLVDACLQQVRHLSLELRPSLLDDLGLTSALRWYLDRQAQRAGFTVHFIPPAVESRLPTDIETACFRTAQEALTNVVRHANAGRVGVELSNGGDYLQLIVRDDGVGFDVEEALARATGGGSLGLIGMQERVQLSGGILEIESVPAHGTEIRASFLLSRRDACPLTETEPT